MQHMLPLVPKLGRVYHSPITRLPICFKVLEKDWNPQSLTNFFQLNLLEWIKQNCLCSNQVLANGIPWNSQFPFAIWCQWKHRNIIVFENYASNPNLHLSCIQHAREYFYYVRKGHQFKHHVATSIRWHKPDQGWFKLNYDGASQGNPRKSRGGGGEALSMITMGNGSRATWGISMLQLILLLNF